jgi:hypothetical protein
MAYFYIYADESGKMGKKSDFVCICGYIGHDSEWGRFSEEWRSLQFRWGVPTIHMSAIMNPERNEKDKRWLGVKTRWGSHWEHDRDQMLREFAGLIQQGNVASIGAIVDSAHFLRLSDKFKEAWEDPYYMALQLVLGEAIDKINLVGSRDVLNLILDDSEEHAFKCYKKVTSMKRSIDHYKNRIAGIGFATDDFWPGIQAADMFAYHARNFMREKQENPDAKPSPILHALSMQARHPPKYMTAAILDGLDKEAQSLPISSGEGE